MKHILLFLFMVLLTSCSNELSRSKAKDILISELGYPQNEPKRIIIKDGSVSRYFTIRVWEEYKEAGLLNYGSYGSSQSSSGFSKVTLGGDSNGFVAELTPEGEKYYIGTVKGDGITQYINVKLADLEFGEITGIKSYPENSSAFVKYTIKRINITPFGDLQGLKEETIEKGANFEKFDDGWRLRKQK